MKKKLKLGDDWFYDGEVSSANLPHGEGILTNEKTKSKHVGKFKNGQKNGTGTTFLKDGLKLTGKWINNRLPDYGIYEYPNGQKYKGELKDGKYHGKGTLIMPDGTFVKAVFKESKIIKELKKSNPKHELTKKEILKNLKTILKILKPEKSLDGKWRFKNPSKKEIKLLKSNKDLMELITFILADTSVLEKILTKVNANLELKKTKRNLIFPYGEFQGEYLKNRKPHGKGTFKYFDGCLYKGEWKNGKYHGKGKVIFILANPLDDPGYDKNWKKSKFRKNQLKMYKKYWKQMHGYGLALKERNFDEDIDWGTFSTEGPCELRGVWNNNQIKYGTKISNIKQYTGEFNNYRENGKGKLIYRGKLRDDSKRFSKFPYYGYFGEWKNGTWHGKGKLVDDMEDCNYLGEDFKKKRVEGDRIVAEWFGEWKNGYETGEYIINVYYFNPQQKLVFKKIIDAKFKKGGTPKREAYFWKIRD